MSMDVSTADGVHLQINTVALSGTYLYMQLLVTRLRDTFFTLMEVNWLISML